MNQRLSPRAVGRAFATLLHETPAAARPAALRACARYLRRARLLRRAGHILDAAEETLLMFQGKKRAEVETASAVDTSTVARIEKVLANIVGAPVHARVRIRPTLIAGFRAHLDGLIADASVRGRLSRLRKQFHSSRAQP